MQRDSSSLKSPPDDGRRCSRNITQHKVPNTVRERKKETSGRVRAIARSPVFFFFPIAICRYFPIPREIPQNDHFHNPLLRMKHDSRHLVCSFTRFPECIRVTVYVCCTGVRVICACKLVARRDFVRFSRNVDYLLPYLTLSLRVYLSP